MSRANRSIVSDSRVLRSGSVLLLVFAGLSAQENPMSNQLLLLAVLLASSALFARAETAAGPRGPDTDARGMTLRRGSIRRGSRIACLFLLSIVAACGGGSGGSDGSDGSGGTGGTGGTDGTGGASNTLISLAAFFPSDLFTSPPVPLELTTTPATSGAATAAIGPAGGTLTTTGPDGTVYTLEIPANALSIEMVLTATPLKDVTGFPFAAQPANRLGVTFTPSGLQFAKSATLTIRPPSLPGNVGIAAFSYAGVGHDAAGVVENIQPGLVTISVDHFSGYVLTWPVSLPEWRQIAEQRIEAQEQAFAQVMAVYLGAQRQKQMLGEDTSQDETLGDFVRSVAKRYQKEILVPRLKDAGLGCDEGQKALSAWFGYWRQMQLLGAVDDPAIAVVFNGVTYRSSDDLPEQLVPTFFDRCMSELYQRCVATGDFFQLTLFMLGLERQWQLLGKELDPAFFDVAVGYAKRCGHWRLDEDANFTSQPTPDLTVIGRVTTSIDLQWKPGDGDGILKFVNAKIENAENSNNTGDLVVQKFNVIATDQGGCTIVNDAPTQLRKATAKLKTLQFEYPDDPATPTWASSGYVSALKLAIDPGDVTTGVTISCPNVAPQDLPVDMYQPAAVFIINGFTTAPDDAGNTYLLDRAWTTQSTNPFRAEWEESIDLALNGTVGLKLFHTPQ